MRAGHGTSGQRDQPVRTLTVWCPDWPVVATGAGAHDLVAVVHANRVVACTDAARAEGVKRGQRRREAQRCCPHLEVVPPDPARESAAFEAVAAAVETIAPRLEVVRPGLLAVPTRGPSRYHGGDHALAALAVGLAAEAVEPASGSGVGGTAARAGVADGLLAAILAARRSVVINPGGSAGFLAPLPVSTLGHAPGLPLDGLVALLVRLGIRTLGDLAALPPADLLGRFGAEGMRASRLSRGLDDRPPLARVPPPELAVSIELDPPADRVDTAAFAARALATELAGRLSARGLACTRVSIEAETEHAEVLARLWRHEAGLGPSGLADRLRWQLDGWLNGPWGRRPTGGIRSLRLVPDEVVADEGRQLGFWGGATAADERAERAATRLQGLLGPDAVTVPDRRGGRGPGEQVALVPAHTVRLGAARSHPDDAPWPGRLPSPSPALVPSDPPAVEVLDASGQPVQVSGRGRISAEPHLVGLVPRPPRPVVGWSGPWPADECWWDPARHRRRARLQVALDDGSAHLLVVEGGRWQMEATYD